MMYAALGANGGHAWEAFCTKWDRHPIPNAARGPGNPDKETWSGTSSDGAGLSIASMQMSLGSLRERFKFLTIIQVEFTVICRQNPFCLQLSESALNGWN